MSVAKSSTSISTDILKLEGNDVLNTWFKQSIAKDPLISLRKACDQPVQWIHPDLPGWPSLSPFQVQLQKCDKCSRKFFSSINCRRHVRIHHRLKKLDKDTGKSRELLEIFWNKLSAQEERETVSFKDLTFEHLFSGKDLLPCHKPVVEQVELFWNINDKICTDENIQPLSNSDPQPSYEKSDVCQNLAPESLLPASATVNDVSLLASESKTSENLLFSIYIARDFLARRWKEANSGDHVKLLLLQESNPEFGRDSE